MTREEILNMPAGRKMDALIAEKFFGFRWLPWSGNKEQRVLVQIARQAESIDWWGKDVMFLVPHYSEDISVAWEVVKKVESLPDYWKTVIERCPATSRFQKGYEYCYVQFLVVRNENGTRFYEGKYHGNCDLPLAICRAAVLLKMEKYA